MGKRLTVLFILLILDSIKMILNSELHNIILTESLL